MGIPVLVRSEEVPVRATQERAQHDQRDPHLQKAELENNIAERPFFNRIVAVPFLVEVNIRNRHQTGDNHTRQHHARHPRIVVHEHFLQPQEIPRGLRRVGRLHAAGRFFQRGGKQNRPEDQKRRQRNHADQFGVNQIRPHQDLLIVKLFQNRLAVTNPLVILHRAISRQPGEEGQQKHEHHDRHVIGLGHDIVEIGIGHRQPEE